jgi:hypothetical protein
LLSAGVGRFGPQTTFAAGNNPVAITAADLNGDGFLDLAVANLSDTQPGSAFTPATVSVLLGTGTGSFQPATTYGTLRAPTAMAVGDFRGAGILDLAVVDEGTGKTGNVTLLVGAGNGTFDNQVSFPVGSGPSALAVADLNGDSRLDLAVINTKGGTVSVLLNSCH